MIPSLVKEASKRFSWRFARYSNIYRAVVYRRLLRNVQFIAITGTAGKTTVKDLSAGILSQFGPTVSSNHSGNDPYAVAKAVLSTRPNDLFSVIEVSGAKPGLLTWPIRIAKPRIAVVTLIQKEHAGAGYTVDDIAQEKTRLVRTLPPDGIAVLNVDDPYLSMLKDSLSCRVLWVGRGQGATLRLLQATSNWPEPLTLSVEYDGSVHEVATRLHGTHLALPVLCSLGVALACGRPLKESVAALQALEPSEGRMQTVEVEGKTFVRDDWKAPLWSLEAPLAFMKSATASRKVIVIGTISDYSLSASKLYPKIARQALDSADIAVFVGPHALRAIKKATPEQQDRIKAFTDLRSAALYLHEELQQGDLVLLKGSNRADHMVRLMYHTSSPVECWRTRCGKSQFCGSCGLLYTKQSSTTALDSAQTSAGEDLASLCAGNMPERILIGLGNSGQKYQNTRHNAGFLMLEHLAREHGTTWNEMENGYSCSISSGNASILLFKPKGAINHTGSAVGRLLNGTLFPIEKCMLIHDDMDLTLGDARLKQDGGDGGHLGVRSVLETFNTGAIVRVRIGVRADGDSRPARMIATEELSGKEQELLALGIGKAAVLLQGVEAALPA